MISFFFGRTPKWFYGCAILVVVMFLDPCTVQAQRGIAPVSGTPTDIFIEPDPAIQQIVNLVDSIHIIGSLLRLEAFVTRHSATDSIVSARNWLVSKFTDYGYTDIVLHPFTWSGRTLHNIVVTKPGTRFPNKYVLLIGHYDSISEIPQILAPGVNDNGSGIALILEVARILATKQHDYSIRFICFSAEEQGLVGSNAYVQNVVVPQNHDIKVVINVDQIGGFRGWANTMVKVERDEDNNPSGNNAASAAYTDTLAALTRLYSSLTTTITAAFGSDYIPFENAGYVITGYYEHTQTPHYHRSTDNFANVAPQYIYQITRGALAGVAYFAGIQRKFLSILHTPHGDTQDTSRSIQIGASVLSSATISVGRVVYRTNWNPELRDSAMALVSTVNDTLFFRGFIPKQPYGTEVMYYLRFENTDTVVSTFPADTTTPIVFMVAPDTIPPVLGHTPLRNSSYLDAPFEVLATATDGNGIAGVWMDYEVNGGAQDSVPFEQLTADLWRGYIPGPLSPGDVVSYRLRARDGSFSANTTSSPATGLHTFRVLNSVLYDFELTNGNFVGSADWQWGLIATTDIPAPPAGEKLWATNPQGNYSNNTVSILESPLIDLTNKTELVLTFKHYYRIEPNNDGGQIRVSVNGGPYELVTPVGGYPYGSVASLGGPGYSGNSFTWRSARFEIPELQNTGIRLQFRFASDLLTTHRGWYVDDVRIDYLDSIMVNVRPPDRSLPSVSRLYQNYPNPFNPSTEIRFDVAHPGNVLLKVYDVIGREVATVVNEELPPGQYAVSYDASHLSSGVYLYRLRIDSAPSGVGGVFVDSKKLVVVR